MKMKKLLSVLMAAVMLCLAVVPSFAAEGCDCGHSPLIIVGGMNGRPLILDEGTANEKQIWPPVIDYAQVALAAGKGLAAYGLTKDWNRLGDAIMPLAVELMAPSACDADGNSMYNITTATYPESVAHYPELHIGEKSEEGLVASAYEKYGGSHVYFFNYDWRLDPMDHAKDLNAMIQKAKAETGHSKVDIAACSMGGAITMAYLATYGYSDIDTCLFITSAFSGSLIGTELLKKNVHIDKDALKHYLNLNVNSETGLDALLDIVVEILDLTGALDTLLNGANSMIEALLDRVYTEILAETMCRMPGVWLLIRDDAYEQAKAAFLDEDENAVLIERIDDYHYNVMQKRKQIIDDAMAAGVKVVFTSHYGDAVLPFAPSAIHDADGLLETECTSAGAVVANLGTTLPEGYTQQNECCGKNHLSPDRIIDASASMFPDQVWFFYQVPHVGCLYGSQYNEFLFWLLDSEEQPTVWTNPAYPQFMTTTDKGMTISPTEPPSGYFGDIKTMTDLFEVIRRVLMFINALS